MEKKYQELFSKGWLKEEDDFVTTFLVNTDGVLLYKSSGIHLWPIYIAVNEIPPEKMFVKDNMLLWGIWQGRGKPDMNIFLKLFMKKAKDVYLNGVMFIPHDSNQQLNCKGLVLLASIDLQARSPMLNMQAPTAAIACHRCLEMAVRVASGDGTAPFYLCNHDTPYRTNRGFRADAIQAAETKKPVHGIKGVSPFLSLPWFDPTANFVIDYMHGALLGVVSDLLELWFSPAFKNDDFNIGHHIKLVDNRLKKMKPPDFIKRSPRSLEGNRTKLKANELRNWLLFYAIPCLQGVLPEPFFKHFLLLCEAVHKLLQRTVTDDDIEVAKTLIHRFHQFWETLYSTNKCGINVHNLRHAVEDLDNWCMLWALSCFKFEDLNGGIRKSAHGTQSVYKQVLRMFFARRVIMEYLRTPTPHGDEKFRRDLRDLVESRQSPKVVAECQGYFVLGTASKCKLSPKILELTGEEDVGQFMRGTKIMSITTRQVLYSKSSTKAKKRISYAISCLIDGVVRLVLIEFFLFNPDQKIGYVVGSELEVDKEKQELLFGRCSHFIPVEAPERSSIEVIIPFPSIKEKVMFLDGNKDFIGVARIPNFIECD